jgi:hypothetical protein
MKTIYLLCILNLFLLTFTACNSSEENNSFQIVQGSPSDPNSPLIEHKQSADGSVTIDRTQVNPAEARNQYRRANLVQVPVDAKYNATIFRITDDTLKDDENKAFIAPKLYAYGTQQGGQVVPIEHTDGTVTLSFNVTFLDGTTEKISNPSADGSSVTVPSLFTVQNLDQLETLLASQFGMNPGLAPLPGCPKKITVIASGKEYDATPANLARGDFCELNVPITVSLTIPEAEAKLIMEVALYAHLVDIEGIYETKVSYPTSKVSVTFDRSKIYNQLQAELGVKAYYVDASVKIATTKVMENQMMQVTVQGETSEFVDQLIEKVTAEFFEPWVATPDDSTNPCGLTTPVCLRFSATEAKESSKLQFDWDETSNLMTGQNYITSTKLKATPNMSRIGDVSGDCANTSNHSCNEPLSNHAEARETGLTVAAENQITVEPTYLVREKRDQGMLAPVRTDHPVCLKSHTICSAWPEGTGACTSVCDQSENHWTEVTTYFVHDLPPQIIADPVGQISELFDGLQFRFSWMDQASGKMKSLDCPLNAFPREGNGRTLVVRVKNVPSCKPFTGVPGETPMLYLLNRIAYSESYQSGHRVLNWDGTLIETPSSETFIPEVSFAGTVSIQGYAFESDANPI